MAKIRYIHTKFWSDNFVREHLNPLDRYLFLYFLTNEKTNICGIYELPLSTMASETGLDKEMLEKMLKRLEGKVDYHDGWVIIRNFIKHQKTGSKDFDLGVKRVYEKEIPLKIRVYTEKTTPSIDPLATLSPHTALPVPVPVPIPILVPVLEREESAEAPTPKELAEAFFDRGSTYSEELLDEFSKENDREIIKKECQKFILYWTEKNKSGTTERWEFEKTFEIKKRIFNWLSRAKDYQPKSKGKEFIY